MKLYNIYNDGINTDTAIYSAAKVRRNSIQFGYNYSRSNKKANVCGCFIRVLKLKTFSVGPQRTTFSVNYI